MEKSMLQIYKKLAILALVLISLQMSGCITRVRYSRMKPSEIDMSDARNIAVFHLGEASHGPEIKILTLWDLLMLAGGVLPASESSIESRVADYASQQLASSLSETGYFSLIDPASVERMVADQNLRGLNESEIGAMLGVDAVIVGSISQMSWRDVRFNDTRTRTREDGTKEVYEVEYVKRHYDFSMSYRVIKTNTGTMITSRIFQKSSSDIEPSVSEANLRDPEEVFRGMIRSITREIKKQLAPYPVTERRKLLRDRAKDPRLERADDFVRNKLYDKALEIYLEVWETTRNEASAYNASIMYELLQNLEGAQQMMDTLIGFYPEKSYMRRLVRLRQIRSEQDRVSRQYD